MQSKMSPILNEIADHFLEMDIENETGVMPSFNYHFSDEDVMNATLIFSHVISNRHCKSTDASIARAEVFGAALHKLVLAYANVNTKTHYNKK